MYLQKANDYRDNIFPHSCLLKKMITLRENSISECNCIVLLREYIGISHTTCKLENLLNGLKTSKAYITSDFGVR